MGWPNSSKWKLSVPCFSLYCLSAACQLFADRLALFTKTPGLEVRSGRARGAWCTCMGHPGLHPQHLKFRLWLALSSLLATQGAAVCLAEDSIDLSGGRAALEVYRLMFASGRRWLCVLDCSGSLLKEGSFVSVHTFQFQMVCLFSVPIIGSGEPAPSFRVLPAQTLSLTE